MNVFEYEGKKCISINGKDYFLIRGYAKHYDKYIFVQVAGNTPLHKEDMPTKDWEIVSSKADDKKSWIAYVKSYFSYDTGKATSVLAFLGATTAGSYYVALNFIAKKFGIDLPADKIHKLADKYSKGKSEHFCISEFADNGNTGQSMVLVEFNAGFDEEMAFEILNFSKKGDDKNEIH
ncbi:MAG: hypothetical protein LHV68_09890 [Elusimicrobia bacterium]|nr:hypothetical protein [Candidatus Liberimonas magnetica]